MNSQELNLKENQHWIMEFSTKYLYELIDFGTKSSLNK